MKDLLRCSLLVNAFLAGAAAGVWSSLLIVYAAIHAPATVQAVLQAIHHG